MFAAAPKNLGEATFRKMILLEEESEVVAAKAGEDKSANAVVSSRRLGMLKDPVPSILASTEMVL